MVGNSGRARRVVEGMITNLKASPEQLRARLELRRSNAARPHKSKKAYDRKDKSWRDER